MFGKPRLVMGPEAFRSSLFEFTASARIMPKASRHST